MFVMTVKRKFVLEIKVEVILVISAIIKCLIEKLYNTSKMDVHVVILNNNLDISIKY